MSADRRQLQFLDLLLHRLGMIDDRMRAEIETPFLRFRPRSPWRPRSGRWRRAIWIRIEPTPPAPPMISSVRGSTLLPAQPRAIEQQFPGGDRGQGKRGGLRERQRFRLAADDALVDQMRSQLVPWRRIQPA